ncbi:hypothetical protein D9M71_776070 [compost metagenome]
MIIGTGNSRFSRAKPQPSANQRLDACISAAITSGLSARRSSITEARVGMNNAAWIFCSSITFRCAAPSKKAGSEGIGSPPISRSDRPSGFSPRYHFS